MQIIFQCAVLLFFMGIMVLALPPKGKAPIRDPFTGELITDKVDEKVIVLITGASTGIGRDTAIEFSKNPIFKVYATMRDPSKANFAPSSLSEKQS